MRNHFGRFSRQVSGYSLEHLLPEHGGDLAKALVGTEGTCVSVLEATVAGKDYESVAASLEFLAAIDYELPSWASDYMAAMESELGDAYSEPAADVRGTVRGQEASFYETWEEYSCEYVETCANWRTCYIDCTMDCSFRWC